MQSFLVITWQSLDIGSVYIFTLPLPLPSHYFFLQAKGVLSAVEEIAQAAGNEWRAWPEFNTLFLFQLDPFVFSGNVWYSIWYTGKIISIMRKSQVFSLGLKTPWKSMGSRNLSVNEQNVCQSIVECCCIILVWYRKYTLEQSHLCLVIFHKTSFSIQNL